jgi:hypothetical protein
MSHINTTAAVASFVFAGKATFTLKSKVTGNHHTYRVDLSKNGEVFFASVILNGSKLYVGIIPGDNRTAFRSTRASKLPASHPAVRAFEWFLKNQDSPQVELHHAGKCGHCARKLTHPDSIASGIGPECAAKLGAYHGPVRGPSGAPPSEPADFSFAGM